MKRLSFLALALAPLALLTACGASGPDLTAPPPGAGRHLDNGDWSEVTAGPDAFRGATVTLTGRVFSIVNSSDKRYRAIHIWADPRTGGQETTVIAQRGVPILVDDYIRAQGTLAGTLKKGNTFGVPVKGPVVVASRVGRVTAVAAASPTRERLHGSPYTVFNVTMTPYRVDLAEDEVRVFLRINNRTGYTIHYNPFQSYLLSDGVKSKPKANLGYPQVPPDIGPESTATGITTFAPVSPSINFKFVTKFSSDDTSVGTLGVTTPIIWTWKF
jgi:hypothetical protein